jgi:hypothetical protein
MILPGLPFGLAGGGKPIEFVGGTGFIRRGGSSTIDLPSGMLPGDLVIVASYSGSTPNYATGYTAGQRGETNSEVGYQWCYKFMPDPVDATATGLSTGSGTAHLAIALRNVNLSTPTDVSSPTVASGFSGTPNPPSITTATNKAMVIALGFFEEKGDEPSPTAPAGYTMAAATTSLGSTSVMAAYSLASAAGAYDPGAFGIGGRSDRWAAATVALRPK